MDFDDLPMKKSDTLTALEKEDISSLGVEELNDRIDRLKLEISRTEEALKSRGSSLQAAEALFGSS